MKNAYIIKGESIVKDSEGNITEIHCTYDPDSKSGSGSEASLRKVKGTLHWVAAQHALPVEVRLYDRLFKVEDPSAEGGDFKEYINPDSLHIIRDALIEPSVRDSGPGAHFQFMRNGYFCVDKDSKPGLPVFNRTVTLKEGFKVKEA